MSLRMSPAASHLCSGLAKIPDAWLLVTVERFPSGLLGGFCPQSWSLASALGPSLGRAYGDSYMPSKITLDRPEPAILSSYASSSKKPGEVSPRKLPLEGLRLLSPPDALSPQFHPPDLCWSFLGGTCHSSHTPAPPQSLWPEPGTCWGDVVLGVTHTLSYPLGLSWAWLQGLPTLRSQGQRA